jgi:hypothetical protein
VSEPEEVPTATSSRPSAAATPRGAFTIGERLARGYGPFFMLAALVVGMAAFVPSRVPPRTSGVTAGAADATRAGTGDASAAGPGTTDGAATALDGTVTTAAPGAEATDGATVVAAAGVQPCADRDLQIPGDPYSPACLVFAGDNGGNTWEGVDATEIHVAVRQTQDAGAEAALAEILGAELADTRADVDRTILGLADYFNQNFQMYGRRLVIDLYPGQGSLGAELLGNGRDKAEIDATYVAEELHAFADLSGSTEPYADALSRRGVLAFGTPLLSREWHTARRPYVWSVLPDCSVVTEVAAEYTLARLADRPALFAGGDLQGRPRRITALAPDNSWYQECVDAGREILRATGYDYDVEPISYQLNLSTMSNQAANIIPRLRSEGVTTILCGCDPIFPVFLSGVANRDGYYPEFVSGYEQDVFGQLWEPEFTKHAFGVSPLGPSQSQAPYESAGYAAYKTVRDDEPANGIGLIYYQMYMLVLGVQMAGPNLTPETYEQAMFGLPEMFGPAGLWTFGPGDYTPMADYHEMYWDPEKISSFNGEPGSWVDPNPGQRYRHGGNDLPHGDPPIPPR